MQREEAIKRLDNWLKVPVDYESILPALADLKYTDQFEDYIQRVAEIEYRSASSIADDVDHYITKVRYELEKKQQAFDQQLDDMAGGDRVKPKNSSYDDDIIDDTSHQKRPSAKDSAREKAFKNYINQSSATRSRKRRDDDDEYDDDIDDEEYTDAIRIRKGYAYCPCCGKKLQANYKTEITSNGVFWIIICVLFCILLVFIPILSCTYKMVTFRRKHCHRKSLPRDTRELPVLK